MAHNIALLPQRPPGSGAVLLQDYPKDSTLLVSCRTCPRAGHYRLASLIARYGPRAGLPDVLHAISADCPRRGMGQFGNPCGACLGDIPDPA